MHRSVFSRRLASRVLIWTFIVAVAGCGRGKKGPSFDLTPVSGTVTLDGKPLPDADVAFYLQGEAPPGYFGVGAKTDASGKYTMAVGESPGAVPGNYKVTVSRLVGANGAPITPEEGMDVEQLKMLGEVKEALSPKYSDLEQTELTTSVETGKADGYDFPLTGS